MSIKVRVKEEMEGWKRCAKAWRQDASKTSHLLSLALCLLAYAFLCSPAAGQYAQPPEDAKPQSSPPPMLRNVGIDQRLNAQVPLDLVFKDEAGRDVKLGDYFGNKPVILSLVYYSCPMLCNQVLNGVVGSLEAVPFRVGDEFDIVTVSFDPRETPALAAEKKQTYLRQYERLKPDDKAAGGWHFLTGNQEAIEQLTKTVGFRYAFDPQTDQFAHASGIMVLTPQGKVSGYFYGIEYAPRDLRLSLVEASENKIGSPVDQLILYCYHYDPTRGQYGLVIINVIRLAGIVTVIAIICLILMLRRRSSPHEAAAGGTA